MNSEEQMQSPKRPRCSVALVHHPCVDRAGDIYTTSVTNLDVHDIARTSRTYDVDAFYIVTPIEAQIALAQSVVTFWHAEKNRARNPDRYEALRRAHVVPTLAPAIAREKEAEASPMVIATSAKPTKKLLSFAEGRECIKQRDVLVVFGTGHGLAPSVLDDADALLAPVTGRVHASDSPYNHLSVRGAVAIILDRLLGFDA